MTHIWDTLLSLMRLHRESVEGCQPPIARPGRDWVVLFLVLFLVFASLLALSVWMYFSMGDTGSEPYTASAPQNDLTSKKLDTVLSIYNSYTIERQELIKQALQVQDPSL